MLVQRLQRWANIKPTVCQLRVVIAGNALQPVGKCHREQCKQCCERCLIVSHRTCRVPIDSGSINVLTLKSLKYFYIKLETKGLLSILKHHTCLI